MPFSRQDYICGHIVSLKPLKTFACIYCGVFAFKLLVSI